MKITEFLNPTAIVDDLAGSTAQEVLTEICRPLTATTGVETQRLVEALLAREQLASTAIGDGLAIPHCKVSGLRGLLARISRLVKTTAFRESLLKARNAAEIDQLVEAEDAK
jgi:PTS system nitrogen regulatory IIA component